jgi:hippurate hydrolase
VATHADLRRTAECIAAAHECTAEVMVVEGFPVTINDSRAVSLGENLAREMGGDAGWHRMPDPIMGAEDFSYVLEKVPGAMFFLGVAESGADWKSCCGIHSSRMMVDEAVLPKGTAFLAACAVRFLERGWG